jgi:hypothetical protein
MLTGKHHWTGPTNLPPSSEDGSVTIHGVHGWANSLIFSHPGYVTLYGNYNDSKLWLGEELDVITTNATLIKAPVVEAQNTNGYYLIPMAKRQ